MVGLLIGSFIGGGFVKQLVVVLGDMGLNKSDFILRQAVALVDFASVHSWFSGKSGTKAIYATCSILRMFSKRHQKSNKPGTKVL